MYVRATYIREQVRRHLLSGVVKILYGNVYLTSRTADRPDL